MELFQVQEKYIHLKSQGLVPNLEPNEITQLFQKEQKNGHVLENRLNSMLIDIGVNLNDFSKDEIQKLTILFLLARNMTEQKNTDSILHVMLFSFIQIAKENNSQYQNEALNGKREFLDQFDFSEKMQSSLIQSPNNFQLADLIYLKNVLQKSDLLLVKTIKDEMHNTLNDQCLSQFKILCEELKQPASLEDEQILKKSISVMAILNFLSMNLPVDDHHEKKWGHLFYAFKEVLNIKRTSKSPSVQEHLDKAFEQYQALIEDGFVAYKMKVHGGSAEHVTKLLYGRSDKQLEKIKSLNREKVVEKLNEYSEQVKMGNLITIETLSTLHSTYNQRVVPRYLSQMRKREHESIQFGKRVGVIPKDVEPAVQEVLNMANQLIKNPPKNKFLYSIEAAKLHNSLLDIHPFLDRNGSTSLIFMELLMAVHGDYTPQKNRVKSYNANLFMILKNSLAVAVVNYEHYKIAHQFGYHTNSLKADKQTNEYYKNEIAKQKLRHKSVPMQKLLTKLWKDFKEIYKSKI
jgi:fido (protein-threonine AMPylation protein)